VIVAQAAGRSASDGTSYEVTAVRYGRLIVIVRTGDGSAVLVSNALHYYEEMLLDRPCTLPHIIHDDGPDLDSGRDR
jgi:hypothetical protein